jgi:two-component system OmpR family response regulator
MLADFLAEEGYAVSWAATLKDAAEKIPAAKPELILLDLGLPDGDGLDIIRTVREHTDVPILVISGKAEMVDKVVGLEMGADDYIPKPLEMKEVAARIKAHLRRYRSMAKGAAQPPPKRQAAEHIRFGSWILDRPRFQVYDAKGKPANLTVKEFRLLEALVLEPNRVLSRAQLLDRMEGDNYNVLDRAIDVHVLRIRKKIGDRSGPSETIKAVRGIGYMLVSETEVLNQARH